MPDINYQSILDKLACPQCASALEIKEGRSHCYSCGSIFEMRNGILSFLRHEETYWQKYFADKRRDEKDETRQVAYAFRKNFLMTQAAVRKLLGEPQGRCILEVGCGHGLMNQWAASCNTLVGVDFTFEFLEEATGRGLIPVHADALALPFKPASFDIVMSIEVIQHFENGLHFVDMLSRHLAPRGTLCISGASLYSIQRNLSRRIRQILQPEMFRKPYLILHDEYRLVGHLARQGFEIEMLYTCFPFAKIVRPTAANQKKKRWISNFFIKARKGS